MARPAQRRSGARPLLVGVRDGSAPAPRDRRHRPPEQTQARAAVVPWRARDHACGACQVARRRQMARARKPCTVERAQARSSLGWRASTHLPVDLRPSGGSSRARLPTCRHRGGPRSHVARSAESLCAACARALSVAPPITRAWEDGTSVPCLAVDHSVGGSSFIGRPGLPSRYAPKHHACEHARCPSPHPWTDLRCVRRARR